MTLQYFEALKALGASPSTKWIIPGEFTSLLRPITESARGMFEGPAEKPAP
jgi:hypothetical protein